MSLSRNSLARERPRLLLTRELSAKLTEGEKMYPISKIYQHKREFQALSPSHGYAVPAPSQRGL